MNKIKRGQVAKLNKDLVINKKVFIPKTIPVHYGDVKINQYPIIEDDMGIPHTNVMFETMKTDDCAIHCLESELGNNVVIMNFASRYNHGGGYLNGAVAQEEDLCRCIP